MKSRLLRGEQLQRGEKIVSPNGKYMLIMQGDGNLVHKAIWEPPDDIHWHWGTNPDGVRAIMQGDGNFCVYDKDNDCLENTGTDPDGYEIVCQNDGNLCIYPENSREALWNTGQADPHGPGLKFDCALANVGGGVNTWKLTPKTFSSGEDYIVAGVGGGAALGATAVWGTLELRPDWWGSGRTCTYQMNGISFLGGYLNINLFATGGSWVGTFHGGSVGMGIFESAGAATFNDRKRGKPTDD